MKYLLFAFILTILLVGCSKENNTSQSAKLRLLQNDWTYISSRIFTSGTNTYNFYVHKLSFDRDGNAIKTTIVNVNVYNYYKYQLLQDDSTLLFFKVTNGVIDSMADSTTITTLNDSMLVIHGKYPNDIFVLDSLRR